MPPIKHNLQRETLQRYAASAKASPRAKTLIPLRLEYSEYSKLLTGYVNKLVHVNRVHPRHLPTQASFRWSTLDPPITNWPRQCIAPVCQQRLQQTGVGEAGFIEHAWTADCWSVRDILLADDDEVLVSWDHDNIEGRIYDLIINDTVALNAHKAGLDLHTITCCNIFGYQQPANLQNPHTHCTCTVDDSRNGSCIHCQWRSTYHWQGKDTKQRVLAKNFNHGSKYTDTYKFVHKIKGIEKYGVSYKGLEQLAKLYIESKGEAWQRKLELMQRIRRDRMARTLYGGRRIFFDSSQETGREGLSHMVSGTVSDYNNITLIMLHEAIGSNNVRLLHNAHDGDKITVKRAYIEAWYGDMQEFKASLLPLIERDVEYHGGNITLTAGVKVYGDIH